MTPADHSHTAERRVRIPADTSRPDRILAGLTARQLVLLAVPAVALWVAWAALRRVVPLPVFLAAAVPVAVVAATLALGRRDGVGLDRLAALALRHAATQHRLVPAPDGVPDAPAVLGAPAGLLPAPLRLPVAGIAADGTLDLGHDGAALLCRASAASFALRTPAERAGMVGAFGRYLNGISAPLAVVVRAEPVDLGPAIAELRDAAPALPHPALEAAALDHADFLAELVATRDLLAREVLVVLRDPSPGGATSAPAGDSRTRTAGATERLRRRAADAATALAAAGVHLRPLDGEEAAACLAAALDPLGPRRPSGCAAPGGVVRGRLDGPVRATDDHADGGAR